MSKYNYTKSIPLDSIPKEEIKRAIHEWSEGNVELEKLLWTCYEKGIETNSSHGEIDPFFGVRYKKETRDAIARMITETLKYPKSQALLSPFSPNPFGGEEWYLPSITMGIFSEKEEEGRKYFTDVNESISNREEVLFSKALELLEFLSDKYDKLCIRIVHYNDEYSFTIEGSSNMRGERFKVLNDIFTETGLSYEEEKNLPIKNWTIKSKNPQELSKHLETIISQILDNYIIETPQRVEDLEGLTLQALFKIKHIKTEQDRVDYDKWLELQRKLLDERQAKALAQKNRAN